ncbi:MAG TPA: hypothetical protein VFM19_04430 [Candidatus Limnocylindria bacterium]|nr:hypothetical protein [Candidatus Limnocylindria bacterium]
MVVAYPEPTGWALQVAATNRVVGFGDGVAGLSYGRDGDQEAGRGVVIADITGATFHLDPEDQPERPATTAAEFLSDLGSVERSAGGAAYAISQPRPTTFAGRSTTMVTVTPAAGYAYPLLEMEPDSHVVYLGVSQRLGAIDVGGAIVLAQVWAANEEDLVAWLPEAEAFLAELEIGPASDPR